VLFRSPSIMHIPDRSQLGKPSGQLASIETQRMKLKNGLEALLISDPETPTSSASLCVETGSWRDEPAHQGTAHFLEHMLFLGTARYPGEADYSSFVAENGGMTNAYTSSDHTVYGFSVSRSSFAPALDRFAQFFVSPLFNESCVERERGAVDQEFRKNVQDDLWRSLHVLKGIASPRHPFSLFNTGNYDTMRNLDTNILREWYARYYLAGAMHLVLYSHHPPQELERLTLESFSDVRPGLPPSLDISVPLFPPESWGKWYLIAPIKDLQKIKMFWAIPEEFCLPDSKVADKLGHGDYSSFKFPQEKTNSSF